MAASYRIFRREVERTEVDRVIRLSVNTMKRNTHKEAEGVSDLREAVSRGAMERLAPILMTALTASLALLPLALGGGESGKEIQTPMALVILCGLLSSTFLNMLVLPALYLRLRRA